MIKQVIKVETKRSPKRDANGNELPGQFVGNFRGKVAKGTPGALHYSGLTTANDPYEYWAKEASAVRGCVRWVDVIKGTYGPKIFLYVENDKFLYQVVIPYDTAHLKQVGNWLLGIKGNLADGFFNFVYETWAKKDKNKQQVMTSAGDPKWDTAFKILDAQPWKPFAEIRVYLESKGLEWEKRYNPKTSSDENDSSKEMGFWLSVILSIQKHLLGTDHVLPFTYGSELACPGDHPLGCGRLNEGELATCRAIWEGIRSQYSFPYAAAGASNADDVFGGNDSVAQEERISAISKPTQRQMDESDSMGFDDPGSDTTDHTIGAEALDMAPVFEEDMPF